MTAWLFKELLQISVGARSGLSRVPSVLEWEQVLEIARQQAVVAVLSTGLDYIILYKRGV